MRTKAIIIKRQAINEHDQIVTCYCEDTGATRAIARGIYRPKSVQSLHLDALSQVEFELIPGRSYPIIASANSVEQYMDIKSSMKRMAMANFFMEVLDRIMFENERDDKLWGFLTNMLGEFNVAPEAELLKTFRNQQQKFLDVLGYAPQVNHCVVCSRDALAGPEPMVALNPELGGALCPDCFIAGGRGSLFQKADLAVLTGEDHSGGSVRHHAVLDTFFEYTVGGPLHSLAFLYSVVK